MQTLPVQLCAPAVAAPGGSAEVINVAAPLPVWQLPGPHAHWRAQARLLDAWLAASLVLLLFEQAFGQSLRLLPLAALLGVAGALAGRAELPGVRCCAGLPHAVRQAHACLVLARGAFALDFLVVATGFNALYRADCGDGGAGSAAVQRVCKGGARRMQTLRACFRRTRAAGCRPLGSRICTAWPAA